MPQVLMPETDQPDSRPLGRLADGLRSGMAQESIPSMGGVNLTFQPTITVQGAAQDADPYEAVRRGLSGYADELKRHLETILRDQRRLSYA